MWREPLYEGLPSGSYFKERDPVPLHEAWLRWSRAAREQQAYHEEQEAKHEEAISCMIWNRLRAKWRTKHGC